MRRIVLLFGAALLAAWAVNLALGQPDTPLYAVRDGLLIATVAALIFSLDASPPRSIRPSGVTYHWPSIGRALWGAGLASSVATAFAFWLDGDSVFLSSLSITLWIVGLALMLIGAFWRGPVRDFSPPSFRWKRDEGGELVREATVDAPVAEESKSGYLSGLAIFIGMIAVLGLGAYLRFWALASSPATCFGDECAAALILIADADLPGLFPLPGPSTMLAALLLRFVDDPVLSLRLSAALIGIATLLALFGVLRKLVVAESALLGTWLLALSGWHVVISRTDGPASATLFAVTLGLWVSLHALGSRDRRTWAVMGLVLGVFALTMPALTAAIWLWAALVAILACVIQRRFFAPSMLALLMAIAMSIPAVAGVTSSATFSGVAVDMSTLTGSVRAMHPEASLTPLNWLLLTLAVLGFGYLLRHALRPAAAVILSGMVVYALAAIFSTEAAAVPSVTALLPFAVIAATLASDQLLRALVEPWRKVVRPAYVVIAAFLAVALIGVRGLGDLQEQAAANVPDPAQPAMMNYLVERFGGSSDVNAVIYVPPALVENPAFQLQGAEWLGNGQVRPMTSIEDALFAEETAGELQFLVPGVDSSLLDLLTAFFPTSTIEPHFDESRPDEQIGQLLFHTMTISLQDRTWPGLEGIYLADGDPPALLLQRRDGPLDFDWAVDGPEAPFVATWRGSLYASEAGRYTFSANGLAGEGEEVTLLIDSEIVLASELDVAERQKTLSQGIHSLDLRYVSGDEPSRMTLSWTRPDGAAEPIPRASLTTRTLPDIGLEAAYFAGDDFQPPAISLRKEPRFDGLADVDEALSVRWTGKVAANRAGEYLFALVGEGDSQLHIDGQLLVDNSGTGEDGEMPGYVEGIAYLEEGWHDIEISYAPDEPSSTLKVLWQPPGGQAATLSAVYLSPTQGEVGPFDLPLPNPPALIPPASGADDFALSQNVELRQARTAVLPDSLINSLPNSLSALPMTLVWQAAGGCGDGDAQMAWPHGVAIDVAGERLYVADSGNWRVAIYDLDGKWIGSTTSDSFEEPHDIGIDPDGQVFVLDAVGSPILRLDPAADAVTDTVEPVRLDTGFYRPRGMSAATAGVIAVADTGGGRVVLLTPDGTVLASYGSPDSAFGRGQPVDVTLTGRALWSITAEDGRLWDLNTNGSLAVVQPTTTLDGPQLVALPDSTLLVTDPERNRLIYLRDDGRPLATFSFDGLLHRPTGIDAALLNGEPYVAVVDTNLCSLSLWRMDALE